MGNLTIHSHAPPMIELTPVCIPLPEPTVRQRIRQSFDSACVQLVQAKERICQCSVVRYSPVISDATNWVTYSANSYAVQQFINMFSRSASATESTFQQYSKLFTSLKAVKIAAVAVIPCALYTIFSEARNAVNGPDRIDAGLRVVEGVGWLNDSTASFLHGLRLVGTVGEAVGTAAVSCLAIGAILSTATIALNSRHLYQGNKFLKRMELAKRIGDHAGIMNMIVGKQADGDAPAIAAMTPYMIKKHFNVDGVKLSATLNEINAHAQTKLDSRNEADKKEGKAILRRTSESLMDRVRSRNFSYALSIVSAVVTLIGLALLLTPLAPIGYGLMATGAFISICKFFYEKYTLEKFEKKIDFNSIVTSPNAMAQFR